MSGNCSACLTIVYCRLIPVSQRGFSEFGEEACLPSFLSGLQHHAGVRWRPEVHACCGCLLDKVKTKENLSKQQVCIMPWQQQTNEILLCSRVLLCVWKCNPRLRSLKLHKQTLHSVLSSILAPMWLLLFLSLSSLCQQHATQKGWCHKGIELFPLSAR